MILISLKNRGRQINLDEQFAIEMLNITKIFPGIIANDNITLRLKKGEIHALLGAGYYCGGGELLCVLERILERFTLAGLVHEQGTVALGRFLEHLPEARHPRNSGDNSPARLLCRFLGYPVPALQFL